MQQLRVVDLAQTMGITSTELIFKLRSIGVSVASEDDALDLSTVRSIITGETLQKRPREVIVRSQKEDEESPNSTARERVARRRRRRVIKTERQIREVAPERREGGDEELAAEEAVATGAEEEAASEGVEAVAEAEVEAVEAETVPEEAPEAEVAVEAEAPEEAEVVEEAVAAEAVEAAPAPEEEPEPAEPEPVPEAEAEPTQPEPVPEAEVQEAAAEEPVPEETAAEPATKTEDYEEGEGEVKPAPEVTEEELTAGRGETEEEPKRVRRVRAKTPLEQNLRELSQEEIKQRLLAQRKAEKERKEGRAAAAAAAPGKRGAGGRKAKAAADAREIRELLSKFEEQKLKGQQEATTGPGARPAPRPPGGGRPSKKSRRRAREQDRRPAPPRPTRTIQFKDGGKPDGPIILSEMVTSRELAEKLNVTAKELLGLLIQRGVMVTANQALPHELAEEICSDLGIEAMVASAEEVIEFEREETAEAAGPLEERAPVVTVMGHVDHGKTSLLDAIRASRVADQEAGGITQHIGASRIEAPDGRVVVFIDTPGHEAFTQMRARGAQVTDLVILVVAADDGVMPQTIEAINHARAANVPLIVAVNKIDKANANPDRVKQQLAEREVLIEEWGGDVPAVEVSAKNKTGISDLLDMILLVAELKELKATASGAARGVVLEARKEKGRGTVATVLIQQGTLNVGDFFFCGSTWGRVRAIADDSGNRVNSAGPSDPVELMGFEDVPGAGDLLQVTESEDKALEVSSYRSQKEKEETLMATRKVSLDTLFDHMAEDETKELFVVIKADVQGSVEVLRDTLGNLSTDKVKINTLHGSVGAVTTNDVNLASASNAIVIGFNVRPERTARELAEAEQVDIRLYTVIYNLIDDVKKAMVGLLEPEFEEEELGHAEVREVFRVPKIGTVAGCHVIDGVILRNAKVRLLRDNVVVHEGSIASLRRFKDDAAEVRQGFDCGIGLERYQDIKEGDVIEAYRMQEIAPEL